MASKLFDEQSEDMKGYVQRWMDYDLTDPKVIAELNQKSQDIFYKEKDESGKKADPGQIQSGTYLAFMARVQSFGDAKVMEAFYRINKKIKRNQKLTSFEVNEYILPFGFKHLQNADLSGLVIEGDLNHVDLRGAKTKYLKVRGDIYQCIGTDLTNMTVKGQIMNCTVNKISSVNAMAIRKTMVNDITNCVIEESISGNMIQGKFRNNVADRIHHNNSAEIVANTADEIENNKHIANKSYKAEELSNNQTSDLRPYDEDTLIKANQ